MLKIFHVLTGNGYVLFGKYLFRSSAHFLIACVFLSVLCLPFDFESSLHILR